MPIRSYTASAFFIILFTINSHAATLTWSTNIDEDLFYNTANWDGQPSTKYLDTQNLVDIYILNKKTNVIFNTKLNLIRGGGNQHV